MEVYRTGSTFQAARITGPTHHFLSVEFEPLTGPHEVLRYEVQCAETNEVVVDAFTMSCVERAVEDCADRLPIHGTYGIRRILISQDDKPSEAAYRQLLQRIIAYATAELAA